MNKTPQASTYRLWHLIPSLLQAIHSRIGKGSANLEHSVEIV